jgi:23S rRNA pseudouridine2605 synthase
VNRLIRVSYGPFQLGHLEPGAVEEITGKVLKEQLGVGTDRAGKQQNAHQPEPKPGHADRRRES